MSNKNSLANKKRKRIKFDATSGSISGFLLSSSESVEVKNQSENSLDGSEMKPVKARISAEFDDSFDLFTSKKRHRIGSIGCGVRPDEAARPVGSAGTRDACSPPAEGKRTATGVEVFKERIRRDGAGATVVPCPFCFRLDEDFYSHVSANCVQLSGVSDSTAARLIEIHSKYWILRRQLGVPDFIVDEDRVFKTTAGAVSQTRSVQDASSRSSWGNKVPLLKWNSKQKKSKYLLLRQSQAQRESKVTQKLAILLMGGEAAPDTDTRPVPVFRTVDRSLTSDLLSSLSTEGVTFWKKCSLGPEERDPHLYYVKALAPFIAPSQPQPQSQSQQTSTTLPSTSPSPSPSSPLSNCWFQNETKEWQSGTLMKVNKTEGDVGKSDSCRTESGPTDDEWRAKDYRAAGRGGGGAGGGGECGSTGSGGKETQTDSDSLRDRELSGKWERMLDSSDLSDTTVLFSDGVFSGHSLVFYSHSVKIFRSISSSSDADSGKLLDWKTVSSLAGRAYIRYIYSGRTAHFDGLSASDLDAVRRLCREYGDLGLAEIVGGTRGRETSWDSSFPSFSHRNRNLTSPDIFEDMDPYDDSGRSDLKGGPVDDPTSSKRKLEVENGSPTDECSKRVKTDDVKTNTTVSEGPTDTGYACTVGEDDAGWSTSSGDGTCLSSVAAVNPGRYERSVARPLSQCSTLPPLSESPRTDGELHSPSRPADADAAQRQSVQTANVNGDVDEKSLVGSDGDDVENNLYYDHDSFDYNNYINSDWTEDVRETGTCDLTLTDQNAPTKVATSSPKSTGCLDEYFESWLPVIDPTESHGTPGPRHNVLPPPPLSPSSPHIIVSDQVTPVLNYSNIISPQLKGELCKYGLKPDMDRNKAKTLLRYIYDSIHPVLPSQGVPEILVPHSDVLATTIPLEDRQYSEADTSSESLLANSGRDSKPKGELDFEWVEEEEEEGEGEEAEAEVEAVRSKERSSYLPRDRLLRSVSEFIKKDAVLFESVLLYVPIWLSKFHRVLKENGVKCTKTDLMDVLDELCITFRTERKVKEKTRRKR